ncbi:hypothetical protein HCH52_00815 [Oscillospiraceae bacterium HV4-5-C5C]|nr:hypothetical protein [Oscillospiraceae bacterium HV4-5-C5C]
MRRADRPAQPSDQQNRTTESRSLSPLLLAIKIINLLAVSGLYFPVHFLYLFMVSGMTTIQITWPELLGNFGLTLGLALTGLGLNRGLARLWRAKAGQRQLLRNILQGVWALFSVLLVGAGTSAAGQPWYLRIFACVAAFLLTFLFYRMAFWPYNALYRSASLITLIVTSALVMLLNSGNSFPLAIEPCLMLDLFLSLIAFFLTQNQTHLEDLLQSAANQETVSEALRRSNFFKTLLLMLVLPCLYLLRRPIAALLNWIWQTIRWLIQVIAAFLSRLLPDSQSMETEPAETQGLQAPQTSDSLLSRLLEYAFYVLILLALLYLLWRYRRQIQTALKRAAAFIKKQLQKLLQLRDRGINSGDHNLAFTDAYSSISKSSRPQSGRKSHGRWQRLWLRDYRRYRRTALLPPDAGHFRRGVCLLLQWLDQAEQPLPPDTTVRRCLKQPLPATDPDPALLAAVYETCRYGAWAELGPDQPAVPDSGQADLTQASRQLDQVLKQLADRLK